MSRKFKTCPFCGIDTGFVLENNGDLKGRKFWVVCEDGCLSEGPIGDSEALAVEGWNRRAPVGVEE